MQSQAINIVPTNTAGVQTTMSIRQLNQMTSAHQVLSDRAQELAENSLYHLINSGQVDMLNHVSYWVKRMPAKDTKYAAVRLIGMMLSKDKLFKKDKDTKKFAGQVANKLLWQFMKSSHDAIKDGTVSQYCERMLTACIGAGLIEVAEQEDKEELSANQKLANRIVPKTFSAMNALDAGIQAHLKSIYLIAHGEAWRGK